MATGAITADGAGDDELAAVRWRAVEARDASAAGLFVYAVRTTGVYCRPGCSARRPLRANVEFFATPSLASSAGYRACRRCRPDAASDQAQPGRGDGDRHGTELAAVVATCRHLEACGGTPDVAGLARRLGWSEGHLRRLFSTHVGVPVGAYLQAQRAEAARAALRSGRSVAEAVYDAGYGSSRAFYEHGAARLGMTPARYRRGGEGVQVAYTVVASALGRLLVAATDRGVCAVRFAGDGDGDGTGPRGAAARPERSDEELVEELARELPSAVLVRDDAALAALSRVVAGAVRGAADATVLPVDLAGTAFQARVWEALRAIPAGQTRTYGELAAAVGRPSAVRAVASACAANPAAVVVPCHRVVPKAGGVGGYRWGPSVKQALLDAEGAELAGRA